MADATIDDPLWSAVDDVLGRIEEPAEIAAQGLRIVAVGRREQRGEVGAAVQDAVQLMLARRKYEQALAGLAELVDRCDQRVLILKGVEVAQRYPDPAWRTFSDLDLLPADAEGLRRDLLDLGYREQHGIVPDDHHHLPPLVRGEDDVLVEVHRRPGWLVWMDAPGNAELFERAVPASAPVAGLWTLDPVDHCLFVAVHHWADGPFRRVVDLLDLALLSEGLDEDDLQRRAAEWGIGRVWSFARRSVDAVLGGASWTPTTRLLARHLARGRSRGEISHRAAVYLADFLVTSPWRAGRGLVRRARDSEAVGALAG